MLPLADGEARPLARREAQPLADQRAVDLETRPADEVERAAALAQEAVQGVEPRRREAALDARERRLRHPDAPRDPPPAAPAEALDGLVVRVASLEDLIRMKRAAGRPQDLVAIEWLSAIRDELARGS